MPYVHSLRQEENQAQETVSSPRRRDPEPCPWLGWAAWWREQEDFWARGLWACCWKKRRLWLRSGCWTKPSVMRHSGDLKVSALSWGLCVAAVGVAVPHGYLGSLYLSSKPALQIEVLSQESLALSLPILPAQKSDGKCENKRGFCQALRFLCTVHAVNRLPSTWLLLQQNPQSKISGKVSHFSRERKIQALLYWVGGQRYPEHAVLGSGVRQPRQWQSCGCKF